MPRTLNPDRDLTDQAAAALDPRLVADLQTAYRQPPPLDAVDVAIRRAVEARVAQRTLPQRVTSPRLHPRLSVPIAALVVLMLSVGAYLHGQSPTPVSAQTILRHAETAGLVPNQVTHFVYQITSSTGYTGTSQFWVQADANGAPEAVTWVDGAGQASTATQIHQHPLEGQSTLKVFTSPSPSDQLLRERVSVLTGTYEAYRYGANLPSSLASSQNLGQQTLDGVAVDIIQPARGHTLYIDARTYILRGADWSYAGVSWHARLLQYGAVPASAAPAGP